jgi:hypothetical protein
MRPRGTQGILGSVSRLAGHRLAEDTGGYAWSILSTDAPDERSTRMHDEDQARQRARARLQQAWERMKAPHATLAEEIADIRAWERAYWSWMGLQREFLVSPSGAGPTAEASRRRQPRLPTDAGSRAHE